ncbi:hypothetical protein [Spirosoma endophyticum]|uniref:Uncharacterized protein n=1 Tax=Spirosoma endophyticum TaxID=662367 RepID=A0A1I2EZ37_9BACT|nr:hypothetical protein [Spirosoma endophyticum]SFE97551.1 hypothetical protein SAMN05216167_12391 [Spirosoma endophyticum]
MNHTNSLFTNLLEEYIFLVAATFIEHVPEETQDKLIALVNQIDPVSPARGLIPPDSHTLDTTSPPNLN